MKSSPHFALLAVLALSSVGSAQYSWSPANTGSGPGGNNNTIPFWSTSATYQQIHEAPTMPQIIPITGMGMRPYNQRTILGRTWELQLTMSQTTVDAVDASLTFSANLGASNSTTVFGTPTTFQTFSWPDFTTNGTTPAFTIPFTTPWLYVRAVGNLCWEWRHKDASINSTMPMDASSASSQLGTELASVGTGCTATGQSNPATATIDTVLQRTGARNRDLRIQLANGAASAAAMMALSLNSNTNNIGWCAPIVTPALLVPVMTDSSGSFSFQASLARLSGSPSFDLYAQFGFADNSLPSGIGLSDVDGYTTPNIPGSHGISRIWKSVAFGTSNGDESATVGSGQTLGYGLSVAWKQ